MNKAGLKKILSQPNQIEAQERQELLDQIAQSLRKIGENAIGMQASGNDDLEFLKLYSKIAMHKASGMPDKHFLDKNPYQEVINQTPLNKV